MRRIVWKMAAVLALCVFVGCEKGKDDKNTKDAKGGKAVAKIVNTQCPFMGEAINDTITVAYKDGKVAFCCKECVPMWEKLSDKEKAEKLASPGKGKGGHDHGDHDHGKKGHDHDKDGHDHDKKGHDHDKKDHDHKEGKKG